MPKRVMQSNVVQVDDSKRSHRWKDLERAAARALGGVRVPRWLDFGHSADEGRYGVHLKDKGRRQATRHVAFREMDDDAVAGILCGGGPSAYPSNETRCSMSVYSELEAQRDKVE